MPSRTVDKREIVVLDHDGMAISCVMKVVGSGSGLATLRQWLRDSRVLLLHEGKAGQPPLVLLDWDSWARTARIVIRGGGAIAEETAGHSSLMNDRRG
jgi:hypothetical protein